MKILIDIGHPGQVHYFRNFIFEMQKKGHEFYIIAREKDVTTTLLKNFGFNFQNRGKGGKNLLTKILYIFSGTFTVLKAARKFKPDLLISFGSIYVSYTSLLIRKPHIAFDDTERSFKEIWSIGADNILTPDCYLRDLGKKQVRFSSYMELGHLHPKRFIPKSDVYNLLGIPNGVKYIILRFVSWHASHDVFQNGISEIVRNNLIKILSENYRVFISSEGKLPDELKEYELRIPPERLHDVLYFSSLYIGEGSTTASECAVMGVPNIYVNSITVGYCKEQSEKYKTCFHLKSDESLIELVKEILGQKEFITQFKKNHQNMMNNLIDLTGFMVWYIENWPKSFKIMKENPDYQYNFK